eukprot:gene1869-biopygen11150
MCVPAATSHLVALTKTPMTCKGAPSIPIGHMNLIWPTAPPTAKDLRRTAVYPLPYLPYMARRDNKAAGGRQSEESNPD